MKKTIIAAAIALGGLAAFTSANAQSSYTTGDALLAFRATGGTGSSLNVQIDVGNLSSLSGAFSFDLSAANSILSTTYGTDWFSRNDLYWGIIGSNDNDVSLTISSASPIDPIDVSGLAAINGAFDNQPVAGSQGGATQGSILDNNGTSRAYSIYSTGYTGSFTSLDEAGYNYFPFYVGTPSATKTIYQLSGDLNTFAPNPQVTLGTVSQSGGVISISAVPEPSSYFLAGVGALALVVFLRRRNA